jgi:hypothetical protein
VDVDEPRMSLAYLVGAVLLIELLKVSKPYFRVPITIIVACSTAMGIFLNILFSCR